MNSDQGSQFTSFAWTDRLRRSGIRISMDGKGRYLDNIFIERLWRTLKYECVHLHAWETGSQAARVFENGWSSITTAAHTKPLPANHQRWSTHCASKQRNPISRSRSELKKRQILS